MDLQNSVLDDIAAAIGFSATLRLAAWFGEMGSVYIPLRVEEGQLLVNLLGLSAARRLTENWPGEHLPVTRLHQYDDDLRRRQIARLLEGRFTPRQISHWMRVTERRVQQICREMEVAGLMPPIAQEKVPGKKPPGKAPLESWGQKGGAKSGGKKAPEC